jgi:hypothetical protein
MPQRIILLNKEIGEQDLINAIKEYVGYSRMKYRQSTSSDIDPVTGEVTDIKIYGISSGYKSRHLKFSLREYDNNPAIVISNYFWGGLVYLVGESKDAPLRALNKAAEFIIKYIEKCLPGTPKKT